MKRNILFLFSLLFLGFSSFAQPSDPANLQLTTAGSSISALWTDLTSPGDSGNEDFFAVVVKNSSNATVDSAVVQSSTNRTITSLGADTYTVTVTAYQGLTAPYTASNAISSSIIVTASSYGTTTLTQDNSVSTNERAVFAWSTFGSTGVTNWIVSVMNNATSAVVSEATFGAGTFTGLVGGLMGGTNYKAVVYPVINNVRGPASNVVYWTSKFDPPNAPTFRLIKNCPTEVAIEIISDDKYRVEEYIIQKGFAANASSWTNFGSKAASNPYISDREEDNNKGRTVFYRVFARNSTGISNPSQAFSVQVPDYVKPPAPLNLRAMPADIGTDKITFRWNYPTTEDKVCNTNRIAEVFWRYRINGGPEMRKSFFPGVQEATIDGLNMKDTVSIEVFYLSDKDILSDIVGPVVARTLGPPDAPLNLGVQGFTDALNNSVIRVFATDNSTDEDGFEFRLGLSPVVDDMGPLGKVKFLDDKGSIVNFFQKPVQEGVTYYYAVRAFNYLGNGPWAMPIAQGTFDYTQAPTAPYNLTAEDSDAGITVNWKDDSFREEMFVIERSSDGGVTYDSVGTAGRNVLTFLDASATGGAPYMYRVRAVNPIGSSAPSKPVAVNGATPAAIEGGARIGVFPNPTADLVNIKLPAEYNGTKGKLLLVDQNFREILKTEIQFNSEGNTLDLSSFGAGMYNVIIITDDNKFSKKVQRF